jgi:hypothetical protein
MLLAVAAAAVSIVTATTLPQAGTRASDGRSYVTGYFALDLDGVKCGLIQKFSGGDVEGDVTTLPRPGATGFRPSGTRYRDFEVAMGLSMGQPVKDWIDASLAMNYMRKSGELKAADFKREVRHIREFKDALLTEIGFPACDGAAKEPAFMTLKFSPWIVRNKKGDGSRVDNPADMAQKLWHPTDFRFTIDGLDKACAKVSKVEALTIKQKVARDHIGNARPSGRQEISRLKITLPAEYAQDFRKWHEETVKAGQGPRAHKSGSLVYLNRTRQKELLTLTLSGLGIFKISAAPRANNEDKIASVTVEMSCQRVRLRGTGTSTASTR